MATRTEAIVRMQQPRGQRLRLSLLLAAAFTTGLMVSAPGAAGSNFGNGGGSCDSNATSMCVAPHGNPHYVYYYPSLTARQVTQLDDTIADYNSLVDSSIQISKVTDRLDGYVGASYGNYGSNGFWAYTACEIAATHGSNGAGDWCISQLLRFNSVYLSSYDTAAGTQAVACHELGHTLGLRHATTSNHPESTLTCMHNTPLVSGTWRQHIRTHDIGHLESKYPQP